MKLHIGRWPLILITLSLAGISLGCAPAAQIASTAVPTRAANQLVLATTTSTENSGLLKFILPDFEKKYHVTVQVVAVGTGQALKLGEDGNADVLLVHDRPKEDAFIKSGFGVNRQDVMYPQADPAGVKSSASAPEAMAKIAKAAVPFISRGDDSGTHAKEKELWAAANVIPSGSWYFSVGQGMSAVLSIAREKQGYALTDRATYLTLTKTGLDLVILCEGDQRLFNWYDVILVNPKRYKTVNADLGDKFIEWITSLETQEKIRSFAVADFGQSLFFPNSEQWRATKGAAGKTEDSPGR